jgi:hypothetical protein
MILLFSNCFPFAIWFHSIGNDGASKMLTIQSSACSVWPISGVAHKTLLKCNTSATLAKCGNHTQKPDQPDCNSEMRLFCGKMTHVKMLLQSANLAL